MQGERERKPGSGGGSEQRGYNLLRRDGGGIYLNIPPHLAKDRVNLRNWVQSLGQTSSREVGNPTIFDSNFTPQARLQEEGFAAKLFETLPPTEVVVAWGVDYSTTLDGIQMLNIVRTPEELQQYSNSLHMKTITRAPIGSVLLFVKQEDKVSKS